MVLAPPTHKAEATGNASLDRIQNNVRTAIQYLRNTFWTTIRAYVALATATTVAAIYTDLISTPITSTIAKGGFLLVYFTGSGTQNTGAASLAFRIVVDDVPVKGLYTTIGAAGYSFSVAIVLRVPVTAGLHTVKVQWNTNQHTATIDPSILEDHANLWVEETS